MISNNIDLGDVGTIFTDLREAITGETVVDPLEIARLELQLKQLEAKLLEGQLAVNKIEAASSSIFTSGWRPSIGWVTSGALAYNFIIAPLLNGILYTRGITFPLPELDIGLLTNLVMAMLGIAGLRTWEKSQGIQNSGAS